jgi:hypothetical protein
VRLVSLLPPATEIVYALGLGEELVGVTFERDESPAARSEKPISPHQLVRHRIDTAPGCRARRTAGHRAPGELIQKARIP